MTQKKLVIFMPSIEGGGVEKNLFIISNFLGSKFEKSVLITHSRKFKNKFKNIKIIFPKFDFKNIPGRKIKYILCLYELIKICFKEKEIVVFAFQANLYCALIGIFFRKIRIITRSNSSPSGWSNNLFKKFIFKILFRRINQVIVNSIIFKKELKKKFNVNAICIYNPLNIREIKILSKKKINNNHFKTNNLKLLNIGRLVDQKDQITFLKALNLLKEKIKFKAIIIGNGIKKKELLNFIKKNKLQNQVKIIKFQKNPFTYIKMTDILVHTAKFEGLPNVLLEAAVLKKFIISTNCPTGPSEILLNGKGGELVKIGDYKKIANIIKYYSERKAKNKITLTSKNLYRFDYTKNLDKYSNVIKKFI